MRKMIDACFMFDQTLKDLYEETGEAPANFFLFYMGQVRLSWIGVLPLGPVAAKRNMFCSETMQK